jgi:osmotically-inducible protein OsmY
MSTIDLSAPHSSEDSDSWAFRLWKTVKMAEDRLRNSAYLELRNISCDIHEGVLTLRGRVPSYHLKQLAQALVHEIEGVLELNNQLDVVAPGDARRSHRSPNNLEHPLRRYM